MKCRKLVSLLLAIALMVCALPCGLAEPVEAAPARGYGSIADYTKVRWFAECDGQRVSLNISPNQADRLEVDALPGTEWTVGAEFIRVRGGRLVPFADGTDVSQYCAWTADGLAWDGSAAALPESDGACALTGRFADDEGNVYTCVIAFSVSADNPPAPVIAASNASTATTVEEKVAEITAECRAEGFSAEYDIAVWLHDWLIYNANYDYTYSNYDASGVLLMGTGVCDSYSKAYCLLLDAFDIENCRVTSDAMNHAWNMAKLDGAWCHIDCTWDDPGEGGEENHVYFGMNAAMMGRDHVWTSGSYPSATSLENYYPIREGEPCYETTSELDSILSSQLAAKERDVSALYVGGDSDHRAVDVVSAWLDENLGGYGVTSYSISYSDYSCTLKVYYSGEDVGDIGGGDDVTTPTLAEPVPAPDFRLESPQGVYALKNYASNGIVLVFGRTTCGNTRALLSDLSDQLTSVYAKGVDVLVSMDSASAPEDLAGIEELYPGYHYTYDANLLWTYLSAVGHSQGSVTFPCVFVIDREGMIVHYSTGYISDTSTLFAQIDAVATHHALPEPDRHTDLGPMLNGTGNVNDITESSDIITAVKSAAASGNVIVVMNSDLASDDAAMLSYFEAHYNMFAKLNTTMLVGVEGADDEMKAAYPHCRFVDYAAGDFWPLLMAAGFDSYSAYHQTNLLVRRGGEVAAYKNYGTLNMNSCALCLARDLTFDSTIPAALVQIEDEAFVGAPFRRLDLTNGRLAQIGRDSFAGCSRLEFIRIPETVSSIGDGAFGDSAGAVIICTLGSAGQKYAAANGFDYICE